MAPGDGGALGGAFEGEFEGGHDVEDLLVGNKKWGSGFDSVADVGVEIAPITGGRDFACDSRTIFDEREFAVVFGLFDDPGWALRNFTGTECGFKGIEFAFEVTSLLSEDDESRARNSRHHGGAKQSASAFWIVEKNVESVVGGEAGALDAYVGGDGLRSAEKHYGLIEEMGRQIEEYAAAGASFFAPGVQLGIGTEPIVGGFETNEATEIARSDGLAEGLEIGVEAAAVIDGDDQTKFIGEVEEFLGFGDSSCKRLVDHDVFACFEAAFGKGKMSLIGSGNGDEADGIDGKQFVETANDADVGIKLRRLIPGALNNCGEAQARHCANNRSVEVTAA